jgi:hypothetical protein
VAYDYYRVCECGFDLFHAAGLKPVPAHIHTERVVQVVSLWFTALRYVYRCLWKHDNVQGNIDDIRKGIDVLGRLVVCLNDIQET